ncbi:MAG: LLM class flavin-dependent oxidoreductase [Campylobacteraceae bacterium]|jgi:FMN-dependent oxidoreductase (nitrilotriacetate monooxygenase family)|nr:LLM class flavin-dependent oxidoreductase [Campylobacteraceae bacterium]
MSNKNKKFVFNAFEMNCVGHQSPGLWRHPRDRSWQYKDLNYWTELAQKLEKGFFTAFFIADVIGYYDIYDGNARAAIRSGAQIPVNDPLQLAGPIAQATKHIGIGVTASTSFEHPYPFARRLTSADHYTNGRVGWNIVTSYLDSGAHNIGWNNLGDHDERYEIADEYVRVIYKLLEGSWEEDAVKRDRVSGVFTDPDKVHEIGHKGKYFTVPGIHLGEPSPQRTPILFQAGISPRGQKFAAQHAEAAFISGPEASGIKQIVSNIRSLAKEAGRDPYDVLVFNIITIIVDESDEKAQAKYKDYQQYISREGALALLSGWTGVDFSQFKPTDLTKNIDLGAGSTFVDYLTHGTEKEWTVEDVINWVGIGGPGPVFVGSATTVADALQAWVAETDVDGFNVAYAVSHETWEDVIKHLVPELQKRGVYPTSYKDGTLREKLFGRKYLPSTHPAAGYRDIEKVKREEAAKK